MVDQLVVDRSAETQIAVLAAASPAFSLTYAAACAIRQGDRPPARVWLLAVVLGVITFLPAAVLFSWFAIAAVLWLGVAGHAVPAVMAERLGPGARPSPDGQLGRADYVHAAGSFATLVILFGLTQVALGLRARRAGRRDTSRVDSSSRISSSRRCCILGGAIVYVDLAARVGLDREERKRLRQAALGTRRPAK